MATIPASENVFPVVRLAEVAAPGTPPAAEAALYLKSDGLLYWKDDAGTERQVSVGDLAAHLADTGDAHDASAVSIVDAGTHYTATDVEAALAEVYVAAVGGGIPGSIFSAKGEILGASANDTPVVIPTGTVNGDVLERDSAATSGNRFVPFLGASYASNAAQSHTSGTTLVIVDYEDSIFDPGSDVTVGASWHYTVPEAGYYLVTACLTLANSTAWSATTERAVLQLYKGGAFLRTLGRTDGFIGAGGQIIICIQGTTLVQLAAADSIDVRFSQNSGSTIAQDGVAGNNYIDIVRVR